MTSDLFSSPFGVQIHCVPDGTVVSDEEGNSLTVDGSNAVVKGSQIYMTRRNYYSLKKYIKETTHDR